MSDPTHHGQGMDRRIERKRWTPKTIAALIVSIVVVAAVVYALVRPNESTLRLGPERITASTVIRGPFQEFIPVSGSVVPINNLYLDAVEGGRVEEIYLEAGTIVNQGDKILRLTNTNLLLDIMWREAELFQQSNNLRNTRLMMEQFRLELSKELADTENRLRQQKRIYERYRALAKDDLMPPHDVELARDEYEYLVKRRELTIESQRKDMEFRQAQLDALESSLERMRSNLDVVRRKQENLTIRAPVSGHLTALNAEVGQLKASGERLGQIDILEGFKVRATVDEHYITRIETGRAGEFDLGGASFRVVVRKIYPEVTEGRFEVDLEFEGESPEGIRRGQRLRLRLELGEVSEAVVLPRGSFFQATGGSWAYVLDESGNTATRRPIRLGRQNPEAFEVLEGLEIGDRVITSSYEGFGNVDKLILN
jgi:HlyD family secretion protein